MLSYLARPDHEEVFSASLVRLLVGCPSEDKWPTIRKLLEDKSPLVRASAAELLGESLSEPNVTALLTTLKDDYRLVRVRAASSLAPLPESAVPENQKPQFQRALAEFLDSMRSRPDDMGSHYNMGNFHVARGNMAEAVQEFDLATRLQPDALPPYVNAALAYSSLGQNDKAEASLRAALRLEPTNAPANLNFGMLMAELGKMSEAEKAFRTAFASDPKSAQAAYNLGILLAKEHPKESLDFCRRAAELAPTNPQYGYTYAFYLQAAGQVDNALAVLRSVLARHPGHEDSALLQQALLRNARTKP
jgi:tetratricopeptide (TPR) repeat protein